MYISSRFKNIINVEFKFREVLRCCRHLLGSIVSYPIQIKAFCDRDDEERAALKLRRGAALTDAAQRSVCRPAGSHECVCVCEVSFSKGKKVLQVSCRERERERNRVRERDQL